MSDETEDWFFTFGQGHHYPNRFVRIHGTMESARAEMCRRYGNKWAMQYDAPQFDGQAERYGLTEAKG